jgi:uncharacterized BrkB/YihY/UPF0761 family membrane protein
MKTRLHPTIVMIIAALCTIGCVTIIALALGEIADAHPAYRPLCLAIGITIVPLYIVAFVVIVWRYYVTDHRR